MKGILFDIVIEVKGAKGKEVFTWKSDDIKISGLNKYSLVGDPAASEKEARKKAKQVLGRLGIEFCFKKDRLEAEEAAGKEQKRIEKERAERKARERGGL